nr:hypothetical protein [Tanacetum cinerariifolium]
MKSEDYYSDDIYVVSNKEDMAYLFLHFTRNHTKLKMYTPYPEFSIRPIEDYLKILKDIKRGPYCKKTPNTSNEANLTMEEYIELEAKKARIGSQIFNWKTATSGKVNYHGNIDYFRDIDADFPVIIYNDALTTNHEVSSEPMVRPLDDNEIEFRISLDKFDDENYICIYDKSSFSYKLFSFNDLKTNSEKDIDEVKLPCNDVIVERLGDDIDINVDTESHEFNKDFETNHDTYHVTFLNFSLVTPSSSTVGQRRGPCSTDSRIILSCCRLSIYNSILLFQESYMSFSSIGGRLSAPDKTALSARLVMLTI